VAATTNGASTSGSGLRWKGRMAVRADSSDEVIAALCRIKRRQTSFS
jgi:hypothetical protein